MTTKRDIAKNINNFKQEITFSNLNSHQMAKAYKLLGLLGTDKRYTGKELAFLLQVERREVRDIVLNIRREMSRFTQPNNDYYLVSDGTKYWITKDYEEIKAYYHKLQTRMNNTKLQWLECQLAMAEKK